MITTKELSEGQAVAGQRLQMFPTLLDEKELAGRLNVTVHAVRRWRFEGRGPKFLKIGRLVRYQAEDVKVWLAAQPTGGQNLHAA